MTKLLFLSLLFSVYAHANESAYITPDESTDKQVSTKTWLSIQRQNTQATTYEDTLTPYQAELIKNRLEDSFQHALPESYITKEFKD